MKAFTLIELLAVMIVLGIILMITVPAVVNITEGSKQKLYEEQINQIEEIARNWGVSNTSLFSEEEPYILTLTTLKEEGLLEEKQIINPITNEKMNGCVKIEYKNSTNQYIYSYKEICD